MSTYFCSYVFIACVFVFGQSLDDNYYRTGLKDIYSPVSDGNFVRAKILRHGERQGEDSNTEADEFEENERHHSRIKREEILCCNSPHLFNATARDKSAYRNCSTTGVKSKICVAACYLFMTNMVSAEGVVTEEGVLRYIKRGTLQRWQKNIALGALTKCTHTANKALRGKRSPQRKKTQGEPDAEMIPALRCTRVGLTFMECMAKALDNNCPASQRKRTKECDRTEGDDMMANGISGIGQVKYEDNPRRIN